jgi:hypothetical protein
MRPSRAAFRSAPVVLNPQYRVASAVVRYGGEASGPLVRGSLTVWGAASGSFRWGFIKEPHLRAQNARRSRPAQVIGLSPPIVCCWRGPQCVSGASGWRVCGRQGGPGRALQDRDGRRANQRTAMPMAGLGAQAGRRVPRMFLFLLPSRPQTAPRSSRTISSWIATWR